ncbi:MAG: cell division protein FtsL [Oscillospiraceae bacterium]|nr:cell division protein FtsL [Oscillospiraceae bacterium]
MSGNAQAFNYYNHTSTAQTVEAMMDAEALRALPEYDEKVVKSTQQKTVAKEKVAAKVKAPSGISVIAVIGTLVVCALMILSILAQINHNEVAIETARLSVEVRELAETHRALSLAFESSINIREVERIARDELGMSRPDASQVVTITSRPRDRAFVIHHEYEEDQNGFVAFITSLFDYFR